MKTLNCLYGFDSVSQKTTTITGSPYTLTGRKHLVKVKTPLLEALKCKSFYYVIEDEVVVDCGGYIEERCLFEEGGTYE